MERELCGSKQQTNTYTRVCLCVCMCGSPHKLKYAVAILLYFYNKKGKIIIDRNISCFHNKTQGGPYLTVMKTFGFVVPFVVAKVTSNTVSMFAEGLTCFCVINIRCPPQAAH